MKRGNIFFIIGPTAAGKTVIINKVLSSRLNTLRAVSYTTREKRPDETDGKDYNFVTKEQFKELAFKGKFIEHSKVYGNFYGTSEDSFKEIENGKDMVKIIDFQGAMKFKNSDLKAHYIFFAPSSMEILKERLKKRGDKDIDERLKVFERESNFRYECDFYLDTTGNSEEDIEKCAKKFIELMDSLK